MGTSSQDSAAERISAPTPTGQIWFFNHRAARGPEHTCRPSVGMQMQREERAANQWFSSEWAPQLCGGHTDGWAHPQSFRFSAGGAGGFLNDVYASGPETTLRTTELS